MGHNTLRFSNMSDHTWLSIAIHTLVVKITCCARNDLPSTYNCSTHLIVGLSGCCSWSTRINPFVHMSKTYPLNIQSRAMTAILYWHYTTPPCYRPMQCTVAFLAIIFLRSICYCTRVGWGWLVVTGIEGQSWVVPNLKSSKLKSIFARRLMWI